MSVKRNRAWFEEAFLSTRIWEVARQAYAEGGSCHDFSHIERVYRLALHIADDEGADLRVVGLAALFHDIGRPEEEATQGRVCHAEAGAQKTEMILRDLEVDDESICRVSECIAAHRFRKKRRQRLSLEAKCLYDADKLDSIGAVGVARAYLWLGERGGAVYRSYSSAEEDPHGLGYCPPESDSLQREWEIKFKFIKDRLYTSSGRKMALRRHETMREFIREMEREVRGET